MPYVLRFNTNDNHCSAEPGEYFNKDRTNHTPDLQSAKVYRRPVNVKGTEIVEVKIVEV